MRFTARNNKRRRRVRGGTQRPDSPVVQPPVDTNPLWSDSATWGGSVPTTNDVVVIPADTIIVLDVNTASLGYLTINGTLKWKAATNATLTCTGIAIALGGRLEIGSPDEPYTAQAVIELTGAFVTLTSDGIHDISVVNDGVSRGIMCSGVISMVGVPPTMCHTTLAASSTAAASTFSVDGVVGWRSGDQVVFGPTDYYNTASGASSALTLSGDSSGSSFATTSTLAATRYGVLQYATDAGMSLTPDTFTPPASPFPGVLDERAPVINTTRNIKIQGKNDTHWSTNGHGAHVMMMGSGAYAYLDGVEFKRCGQKAALGRYPMHWHMISYVQATGAFISDNASVMKNCSVWESMNRAIVVHGTCGVEVDNNVCFDIKGHAIFLEDASERRNKITDNVVLKVRDPGAGARIKRHDAQGSSTPTNSASGPSGFWITNHDNTISRNRAADCQGVGFWSAMSSVCFGNSALVSIKPRGIQTLEFSGNIGHSNGITGHLVDFGVINEAGSVSTGTFAGVVAGKYEPTVTGNPPASVFFTAGVDLEFTFHQSSFWKNNDGGYRNRTGHPIYSEWVTADNGNLDFSGVTNENGSAVRCLAIGTSLNTGTYPASYPRGAFATYHTTLRFTNSLFINFPFAAGVQVSNQTDIGGGTIRLNDLYTQAIFKSFKSYTGNTFISCNQGFRSLPPHLDGHAIGNRYFTLAGAVLDTVGIWTTAGWWWVYDNAFLTDGLGDLIDVEPAGQNGKATQTAYHGIGGYYTDFNPSAFAFYSAVTVTKVDNSLATLGTWAVGSDGTNSSGLALFRHAALQDGARFIVSFPSDSIPTSKLACAVNNIRTGADTVIVGLPWSGSVAPKVGIVATTQQQGRQNFFPTAGQLASGIARQLTSAASRAAVEAGSGTTFYRDTANNLVWIRCVGGLLTDPGFIREVDIDMHGFNIIIDPA